MPWWGWLIVLAAAAVGGAVGSLCRIAGDCDEIERERQRR